ncbi:MAG: hypothetical protein JST12_14815 [Armatimonadetes bacterium]|nr:hypothetical protein [Armatimonadota bacterium]
MEEMIGVYDKGGQASNLAFFGLFALQHRGQEGAGIAASVGNRLRMHKDMGLVSQIFFHEILDSLTGHISIGHTMYSGSSSSVLRNTQPFYFQSLQGEFAIALEGNLINAREIREQLTGKGHYFETTSDAEVIAHLFVETRLHLGTLGAVETVMKQARGAYTC